MLGFHPSTFYFDSEPTRRVFSLWLQFKQVVAGMKMIRWFQQIGVCSGLLVGFSGLAQNAPSSPTSEANALVTEALSHNPELRFYEAEIQAVRSLRRTATRLPTPELTGAVGQKRTTDPAGTLAGEGVAWSVGVVQSFEWPGRLGLRKAIANQDVVLAELGYERFKLALAARVRSQAHGLAAAAEKARVAREVADRYRALREVLVQRDPAGITPQLELRILEATEVNLRRRATEAELAEQETRVSVNLLRGQPADTALSVPLSYEDLPEAPSSPSLIAMARTNNFELRLRAAELEQQGLRVDLARNERWPAFKLGPQFSEENAAGQDRILGVVVSFPLPLWRNNQSNIEAAKARQIQAEALLFSTEREIEKRVINASRSYDAKRKEMNLWKPDAVKQFAEAAALADRHYRLAAVPATVYVELQKQYLDAVETLLDTRRETLAAAAELEELTGLPLIPVH